MKVLLHTPDLNRKGGVATFCSALKGCFNCEVDYFTSGARGEATPSIHSILSMLLDYARYFLIMMNGGYDVIQVNPSLEARALFRDGVFILIAKCFRKRVVVFMHGWNMDCERELCDHWLWLFRRTYFLADAFIVLANEFKKRLQLMGYYKFVYLGRTVVDSSLISSSERDYPSRSSISQPFNILFLSRIEKEKGIMEALKSYELLKAINCNVSMTVAGDGEGLDEAKQYVTVRKIEGVQFVGFVHGEQKVKLFLSAQCYLFPSYYGEGMPISVLEAMTFGLPIITRPVAALADFFKNGIMGYMTESKSPEILAQLIRKLIDDPLGCNKMSKYNRKYAIERFNALSVAAEIESIYFKVQ
jgi:glycosyltransferase involved in cell wall biosynthesis